MTMSPTLWQETPLVLSSHLSQRIGCNAYIKLENVHPSHSFKHRGISHFVQEAKKKHGIKVHVVIASGGNAGIAAAVAAKCLDIKCTVYLIEGATQRVLDFLEAQKAEIIIQGKIYAETLRAAQECVEADVHGVMVPAYDHELVWEGHSSMIKEIHGQLAKKPDAVLCSVGGGGLLGGIMLGLAEVGWDDVPVVALETLGCNCFHHSIALNKGYPIELPTYAQGVKDEMTGIQLAHFTEFHSIATGSLGASQPSARVVAKALARDGGIKCASIPDFLSMKAAVQFAEDHQTLVEPACSTTLAAAFSPELFNHLVPLTDKKAEDRTVVFIVCGGFKITLAEMAEYQRIMNQSLTEKEVTCLVDGENVAVAV